MKAQKKPNRWSCLPVAFAIAINENHEDFISSIGHDGSRIISDRLVEPLNRIGFHVQECILAAIELGYPVTPLEFKPMTLTFDGATHPIYEHDSRVTFMLDILQHGRGVLVGDVAGASAHAVAFEKNTIVDPDDGLEYPLARWLSKNPRFGAQVIYVV